MNLEQARFNMVEQQIRTWEVLDQEVLDLLLTVKREISCRPPSATWLYADTSKSRSATAPAMLTPRARGHIRAGAASLQVATTRCSKSAPAPATWRPCWRAAASQVSHRRDRPELAATARENLQRAGIDNVTVETGDGAQGLCRRTRPTTPSSCPAPYRDSAGLLANSSRSAAACSPSSAATR
jgi:protein-L-isoaspartate(D-aspartate) O-methyltransferase